MESLQKIKSQMAFQILYLLTLLTLHIIPIKKVHIKMEKKDKSLKNFRLDVISPFVFDYK